MDEIGQISPMPPLSRPTSPSFHEMIAKTKKFAIEKVVKAEPTPETATMTQAFDTLQQIESKIDDPLVQLFINLYNQQVNSTKHNLKLSETLMSLTTFDTNDLFKNFVENVMSRKLFKLNTMNNQYLDTMKKHLIDPITQYKSADVPKAHQLIETYDSIKTDYDFAVHRLQKAVHQQKTNKIDHAQTNRDNKFASLQQHRTQVIDSITAMTHKQQTVLLDCVDEFWKAYLIHGEQQAQILELKDNFDEKYETEKKIFNDHLSSTMCRFSIIDKKPRLRDYQRDSRINTKDLMKLQLFTAKMEEKKVGIQLHLEIKSTDTNYPVFKVDIDENALVSDLKALIEKGSPDKIVCLRQRLIHKGRLLKDRRTLKRYKISDQETIMLVRSTRNQTKRTKVAFATGVAKNTNRNARRRAGTVGSEAYKRAQTPDPQQLTEQFKF
eukprot:286963_1